MNITKNQVISLAKKSILIKSTASKPENLKKSLDLFLFQFKPVSFFNIQKFSFQQKPSAIIKPTNTDPNIWLSAHLDVVPGSKKLFKPQINGYKLVGRGAQDMKTAAAAMTLLVKQLIIKGFNIGLVLTTDEEIGGHHGTKTLINKNIIKPKFVIAGEPTNLQIGNQAKGVIKFVITSKGKSAHSSRPWLGKNAINQLIPLISQLNKTFPTPNKSIWKTTCNLSSVKGGTITNQVPDQCQAVLDIRFIPKDNPKTIIKSIKSIFKKQHVFVETIESHIFTHKKNPLVNKFAQSVALVTKNKPIFKKNHGSSDIRFITKKNVPAITFGLKGSGLHSNNEWVDTRSILPFIKILNHFIERN